MKKVKWEQIEGQFEWENKNGDSNEQGEENEETEGNHRNEIILSQFQKVQTSFVEFLIRISEGFKDQSCYYARFNLFKTYNQYHNLQQPLKPTPLHIFAFTLKQLSCKFQSFPNNEAIHSLIFLLGLFLDYFDEFNLKKYNISKSSQYFPSYHLTFYANTFMTEYLPNKKQQLKLQYIPFFSYPNITKSLHYLFMYLYCKGFTKHYLIIKTYYNKL